VEAFLSSYAGRVPRRDGDSRVADPAVTFIVDPPRTGMSRDAMREIIRAQPARLVYVSCDAATLARDTRMLLDADYSLDELTGIDLFPNTAHVEAVATFNASRP
jgi:23S rRNA (uracil1939-C5)-methyltransferase